MAKLLDALRIAHQVADRLAARGLHGRFTVGFPGDDDWGYAGWHEYRAVLRSNQSLTVDQIFYFVEPFRLLAEHYRHRASVRVRFAVENDEGEAVPGEWRSITRTMSVDAAFSQIKSRTRRLAVEGVQSSTYLAVDGVSVLVEPQASHD